MIASPAAGRNAGTQTPGGTQGTINVETIANWLRLFIAQDQVVELRAIHKEKGVEVGYFDYAHLDDMARCAYELSESGDYKGIYFTLNPLDPALLLRAPYALQRGRAASTDRDVTCRRWMLIDVDTQREGGVSATAAEKDMAAKRALEIGNYLRAQGWPIPVLADSGNGYHVLVRIDLPCNDGNLVKRVLHALADRFDGEGITVDAKVFNPSRLTKVYGTMSRKGIATTERPHRHSAVVYVPTELGIVPTELLERLAGTAPVVPTSEVIIAGEHAAVPVANPVSMADKLKLAERYLDKVPAAVEGKGGDKQTFTVACLLIKDFDLTVDEALPLLLKYNQKCVPPWDVKDLQRKLELADQKDGERGRLLRVQRADLQHVDSQPAASPSVPFDNRPFLGVVPDFIQWDAALAHPRPMAPSQDKRGRSKKAALLSSDWVLDVVRYAVVTQRCSVVVLPDVYLAHLVWGPTGWPANWRRTIADALLRCAPDVVAIDPTVEANADGEEQLQTAGATWRLGEKECPSGCPLHGRPDVRHRHFCLVLRESAWGVMRSFVSERLGPDYAEFDFRNRRLTREEVEARRREMQKQLKQNADYIEDPGNAPEDYLQQLADDTRRMRRELRTLRPGGQAIQGVRSVYLPARLFGPSPRSCLTVQQCKLLAALPLETTRHARHNRRPDKAQILTVGAPPDGRVPTVPIYPGLTAGEYVLFNGTGTPGRQRLHGHGFKLTTWMHKAGYGQTSEYPVIGDLQALQEPFGLTVAAWNTRTREWKSLEDLAALTKTPPGRTWLAQCVLRVYTAADYLNRWRRYFAERLGFSSIPGVVPEQPPVEAAAAPVVISIRTPEELHAWMRQQGLTDADLAARLGMHRTAVNRYRTGRRRWRAGFQTKLDALLAEGKASHNSLHVGQV